MMRVGQWCQTCNNEISWKFLPMGRKPRLHYPGALYHVILRGNAREKRERQIAERVAALSEQLAQLQA
jgi:hypothetical protein